MTRFTVPIIVLGIMTGSGLAQDFIIGGPTFGGNEPVYSYDDQEVWKHGWFQVIPYYGGHHTYRPYNYKQVYAQAAQSEAWGMPRTMPYSQQYYHRYENFAGQEFPNLSKIQSSGFGPNPSAMNQAQWKSLGQSPLVQAGYDHRQGSAFPQNVAPVDFQKFHASPASGPELERESIQRVRIQQLMQRASPTPPSPMYEPLLAPGTSGQ